MPQLSHQKCHLLSLHQNPLLHILSDQQSGYQIPHWCRIHMYQTLKPQAFLKCLLTKTFWGLMHSVTNLRPQVGHHPTIRVLSTNMIRLQRWIQELAHTHTLQSMDLWIHIHKWRFSKWTGLPSKHLNIPPQKRRLKHEKLTLVSLTHLFISTQLCSHQVKLTFFKACTRAYRFITYPIVGNLHWCKISRNALFALEKILRFIYA